MGDAKDIMGYESLMLRGEARDGWNEYIWEGKPKMVILLEDGDGRM